LHPRRIFRPVDLLGSRPLGLETSFRGKALAGKAPVRLVKSSTKAQPITTPKHRPCIYASRSNNMIRLYAVPFAVLILLATTPGASAFQAADPIPQPIPQSGIRVRLEPVADGLGAPIYLTTAVDGSKSKGKGDDDDHSSHRRRQPLYVVDQTGKVLILKGGQVEGAPLLDISDVISGLTPAFPGAPAGLNPGYDERGLLGLAFHPDFTDRGKPGYRTLYTLHNVPVGGPADFAQPPFPPDAAPNCQEVIAEWKVNRGFYMVEPTSYREILRFDKPQFNHNGGTIVFGADGDLYASFGDGGAANDVGPGHIPGTGNAQNLGTILGKVIRINPLKPSLTRHSEDIPSANGAYRIPRDNPFVRTPGAVKEIYAYGLRNPYRMSFDDGRNRLIVADVGQNNIEEVDVIRRGGNFGWHVKEGTFLFDAATGAVSPDPDPDRRLIDPVVQYDHNPSESLRVGQYLAVAGGFVYRGSRIPALRGKYVFADLTGILFVADLATGKIAKLIDAGIFIKGFGEDEDDELYALGSANIGPGGDDGVVLAIKPAH